MTVLDLKYIPIGPIHLGKLINSSVTIRGPLMHAELCSAPEISDYQEEQNLAFGAFEPAMMRISTRSSPDFDYGSSTPPIAIGDQVTILMLGEIFHNHIGGMFGLILRHVSGTTYERIGQTRLKDDNEDEDDNTVSLAYVCALPLWNSCHCLTRKTWSQTCSFSRSPPRCFTISTN